ncbi:MAG: HAMP domain-containing protein [Pirellulales bacterium]|nr:HAMP domain-containing protein [Pirellulales bacterium]
MRGKVIAILALLIVAVLLVQHFIASTVILPQFLALEHQKGERDVRRVQMALKMNLEQMAGNVQDYAQWDPMYAYVENRNPDFTTASLSPRVFENLQLNCIYVYDADGKLVWGQTRDYVTTERMAIAGLPERDFARLGATFRRLPSSKPISGFLACGDQLLLAASSPILTSKGEGPSRGHVVFSRLLLPDELQKVSRQVRVKFTLCNRMPGIKDPGNQAFSQEKGIVYDNADKNNLDVFLPLVDLHGATVCWIVADIPRQISVEGRQALSTSEYTVGVAGLLILAAAYWSFGRFVLRPVERLTRHVQWIRQSGDLTNRLNICRTDEVGILASEFDQLLSALAKDRASRRRYEQRLRAMLQEKTERAAPAESESGTDFTG